MNTGIADMGGNSGGYCVDHCVEHSGDYSGDIFVTIPSAIPALLSAVSGFCRPGPGSFPQCQQGLPPLIGACRRDHFFIDLHAQALQQ